MYDTYKIKNLLLSIVSAADLLENDKSLDTAERDTINDVMRCNFEEADKIGISYVVQNAALSAGRANNRRRYASSITREIMDKYADRLTPKACARWKEFAEARRVSA